MLRNAGIPVKVTRIKVAKVEGSTLKKLIEKKDENEAGIVMARGALVYYFFAGLNRLNRYIIANAAGAI